MEISRRDAFDLALVAVAVGCVVSYAIDPSGSQTAVGDVVSAVAGVNPLVSLVVLGAVGTLFLAYVLLYLPTQQAR